jgi:hypothetical protein
MIREECSKRGVHDERGGDASNRLGQLWVRGRPTFGDCRLFFSTAIESVFEFFIRPPFDLKQSKFARE